MKLTQTQKLVLNQAGRFALAVMAGTWISKTSAAVMKTERSPINKIAIYLGGCTAAFAIGLSIDQTFNKLPPYDEEERIVYNEDVGGFEIITEK